MDPLMRLADYEDSDDEDRSPATTPGGTRRRRSSVGVKRRRTTSGGDVAGRRSFDGNEQRDIDQDEVMDDSSHDAADVPSQTRTRRSTELPEAPSSANLAAAVGDTAGGSSSREASDHWITDEEDNALPGTSAGGGAAREKSKKKTIGGFEEPSAPRGGGAAALLQQGDAGQQLPSPSPALQAQRGGRASVVGTPTLELTARPPLHHARSGLDLVGGYGGEEEKEGRSPPPPPPGGGTAMHDEDELYHGPSSHETAGEEGASHPTEDVKAEEGVEGRPPADADAHHDDETRLLHDAVAELADGGRDSADWTPRTDDGSDDGVGGSKLISSSYFDSDVTLPPEPETPCDPQLIEKFHKYFAQKEQGYDFNAMIQKRKDFRNPSMYEKLIKMFDVDEFGSNFPKSVFDPHGFKPTDYYDKIAEQQKIIMDKLAKHPPGSGTSAAKHHAKPPEAPSAEQSEL